jgi:hypothetical protein
MTLDGKFDALWRVYSPQQYEIRIKTTPSILAEALLYFSKLLVAER